jgi:hypothetical protein
MCSGMKVFFVVFNLKKFFEKSKMKKEKLNLLKGFKGHWDLQPSYIKTICGGISDSINSQIITLEHVRLFVLNHYVFNDDVFKWSNLKTNAIVKNADIYSQKRYERDKQFIVDVMEKLKPKTVFEKLAPIHDKLYKINPDGKNYLYELVINKYVGPPIFAIMYKNGVFTLDESKLDERMFRFVKATKQITNSINSEE